MQNMHSRETEAALPARSIMENPTYLEATLGRKFPFCGNPPDNTTSIQSLANCSSVTVVQQGLTLFRSSINKLGLVH